MLTKFHFKYRNVHQAWHDFIFHYFSLYLIVFDFDMTLIVMSSAATPHTATSLFSYHTRKRTSLTYLLFCCLLPSRKQTAESKSCFARDTGCLAGNRRRENRKSVVVLASSFSVSVIMFFLHQRGPTTRHGVACSGVPRDGSVDGQNETSRTKSQIHLSASGTWGQASPSIFHLSGRQFKRRTLLLHTAT